MERLMKFEKLPQVMISAYSHFRNVGTVVWDPVPAVQALVEGELSDISRETAPPVRANSGGVRHPGHPGAGSPGSPGGGAGGPGPYQPGRRGAGGRPRAGGAAGREYGGGRFTKRSVELCWY